MVTKFTKAIMVVSFFFYGIMLLAFWGSAIVGWHNEVWDTFDIPVQNRGPASWILVLGFIGTAFAFAGLGLAYMSVWKILDGGTEQDFRVLARRLRKLSIGLFGFWLGYNFVSGGLGFLVMNDMGTSEAVEFSWDPFSTEIIYLILAVAIFAISKTLHRAWEAEEEARHFL